MNNDTGPADPRLCPGSSKQALQEGKPRLGEPWFSLCPVCRTRLQLGFAGIVPDHPAPRPDNRPGATPEPESGQTMVVWVDGAPFIYGGSTLTYAPQLLHQRDNPREDRVAWIDGARFVKDGATLVYTPELIQKREPAP